MQRYSKAPCYPRAPEDSPVIECRDELVNSTGFAKWRSNPARRDDSTSLSRAYPEIAMIERKQIHPPAIAARAHSVDAR